MKTADTIPFGVREGDGRIVTAMEVPRGTACRCLCPVCGTHLQAHQGDILSWHFQHQVDHSCIGSAETGLHMFAKQIIADKRAIYLPPLVAQVGADISVMRPGRWARLNNVRLEERLGFAENAVIVPDIIAEMVTRGPNNSIIRRDIVIEIVVTHFSTNKKKRIIAEHELPALEIHLSRMLSYDQPSLYACTADILKDAPRYWLWHEDQAAANATLDAHIREREVQTVELAEWRRRFSLRNSEHKRFYNELKEQQQAIQRYYDREVADSKFKKGEIEQYRTVNKNDVAMKRREKQAWVSDAANTLGKTTGPFAASKLVAWANDWREKTE